MAKFHPEWWEAGKPPAVGIHVGKENVPERLRIDSEDFEAIQRVFMKIKRWRDEQAENLGSPDAQLGDSRTPKDFGGIGGDGISSAR